MRSCPIPGLSEVSSTAVFVALPFVCDATASPFMRFSETSASLRSEEGVRWSGVVCFCRPIAMDTSSRLEINQRIWE